MWESARVRRAPRGSEATETQTRREEAGKQAGADRQTDRGNKRSLIKKINKLKKYKLAASLPTSAAARRASGRQIKLDYNSRESSAHCGQQSVFADLSALRVQICITTGGGGSSFELFLFYLFLLFLPESASKILSRIESLFAQRGKENSENKTNLLFLFFLQTVLLQRHLQV